MGGALPRSIRICGLGGLLAASDRLEQEDLFISRARGDENARLGFYVEGVIFWGSSPKRVFDAGGMAPSALDRARFLAHGLLLHGPNLVSSHRVVHA